MVHWGQQAEETGAENTGYSIEQLENVEQIQTMKIYFLAERGAQMKWLHDSREGKGKAES